MADGNINRDVAMPGEKNPRKDAACRHDGCTGGTCRVDAAASTVMEIGTRLDSLERSDASLPWGLNAHPNAGTTNEDIRKAYQTGEYARRMGRKHTTNPYTSSELRKSWSDGWNDYAYAGG